MFIAVNEFEGHGPDSCSVGNNMIKIIVSVNADLNTVYINLYYFSDQINYLLLHKIGLILKEFIISQRKMHLKMYLGTFYLNISMYFTNVLFGFTALLRGRHSHCNLHL